MFVTQKLGLVRRQCNMVCTMNGLFSVKNAWQPIRPSQKVVPSAFTAWLKQGFHRWALLCGWHAGMGSQTRIDFSIGGWQRMLCVPCQQEDESHNHFFICSGVSVTCGLLIPILHLSGNWFYKGLVFLEDLPKGSKIWTWSFNTWILRWFSFCHLQVGFTRLYIPYTKKGKTEFSTMRVRSLTLCCSYS